MARVDPNFRLRISNELLDTLRARAEDNKRSVSQEIVHILSQAIQVQDLGERISNLESKVKELEKNR